MKISLFTAIAALALFPAVKPAHGGDTLVQVSTIDALLQGIFDGEMSFGELKKSGNFGIGTLDDLDGEMLALDGKFYQVSSDGMVREIADEVQTPFAAVTFFKSDKSAPLEQIDSLEALQKRLDVETSTGNLFHAIKITGTFSTMSVRSVARQKRPFPTLTEAAKKQVFFKYENVRGTLIGFRCPVYVKGINVPGYHFHFLSEDRKQGGHVFGCSVAEAQLEIDTLENFKMLLPKDAAFLSADFTTHDAAALDSVEKLKLEKK